MHQVTSAQGDAGTRLQLLGPTCGSGWETARGPPTVQWAWALMEDIPGHVSLRGRRSDRSEQARTGPSEAGGLRDMNRPGQSVQTPW